MNIDLSDEFSGWRVRGRELVSDDGQRMSVGRLRGLLWRDKMELRLAGFASRRAAEAARSSRQTVKVVVIDLGLYRVNGLAAG